LTGGAHTYLNSTDIIRCTLRSAAYSLLSSHYALLYGSTNGWEKLPLAQGWAPVSSWLGSEWNPDCEDEDCPPLPDETQKPGVQGPPAWVGQGDYCSPFNIGLEDFEATRLTPGSIGKSTAQDDIYFTPNCFTDLGLSSDSALLKIPRLAVLLRAFDAHLCYGFRTDVVLCSANGQAETDRSYPLSADLQAAIDALDEAKAVDSCDLETVGCKEAKNRKLCATNTYTEEDLRFQSNDLCSIAERTLTGSSSLLKPVASMSRRRAAEGESKVEVGAWKPRDLKKGTADLHFYSAKFLDAQSDAMYGMVKPADQQMRQGLHNLVTYITDHAIALSMEPDANIGESNKHYQVIYKYSRHSLDSGKEWSMGLTKSMLIYLDEALGQQQNSLSTILAAYIVVLTVLLLQYLLLGHRIELLIARHKGGCDVIKRLMAAAEACVIDGVTAASASADEPSTSNVADDDLGSIFTNTSRSTSGDELA
jgi:hypothetical protein